MNKLEQWRALADVRGAIHGWAFSSRESLAAKLARAESLVTELPEDLRADGDALLAPLRSVLAEVPAKIRNVTEDGPRLARMTVTMALSVDGRSTAVHQTYEMTPDLPGDALGEAMVEAMRHVRRLHPVDGAPDKITFVVTFNI